MPKQELFIIIFLPCKNGVVREFQEVSRKIVATNKCIKIMQGTFNFAQNVSFCNTFAISSGYTKPCVQRAKFTKILICWMNAAQNITLVVKKAFP